MSTSKTVCTCALVRSEAIMCSAIFLRITDIGSTEPGMPPGLAVSADEGAPAAGVGPGCAGGAGGVAGADFHSSDPTAGSLGTPDFACSINASMSSLVTRPPVPLPEIRRRSTLCSAASLRTRGEVRTASPDAACDAGAGAGGEVFTGASAEAFTAGVSAAGLDGAAAGAPAAPDPPITATTVLTWTVFPVSALISVNTPEAGAGISASTLSVEISKSGSSRLMCSPTFLSHLVMVPSKMDSPICGMTTLTASAPVAGDLAGSAPLEGVAAGELAC